MQLSVSARAAIAMAFGWLSAPAAAQLTDANYDACENRSGAYSDEQQITACTALIQAGDTALNLAASYSNRGNVYARLRDWSRAIADYDESLRLDPSSGATYRNRALTYYDRNDLDRARADFDEALRLDPSQWEAWRYRGTLRTVQGDYEGAKSDLSQAIDRLPFTSGPDAAALFSDRAVAALQQGDFAGAIADFNVALQKNVFDLRAYLGRATANYSLGNWQQAFDDYSRYLESNQSVADVWDNRCVTRAILGHPRNDVVADCNKAWQLSPRTEVRFANKGFVALKLGDWLPAETIYNDALDAFPSNPAFLYGRGIARMRLGKAGEGAADIQAAIRADPEVVSGFEPFGIAP